MTIIMAKFLNSFFLQMNSKGITYCILRNYEHLPFETGNDVDFLVKSVDLKKIKAILYEMATLYGWSPLQYTERHGYIGIHFLKVETREFLLLDFYHELHHKGIPVVDVKYVFSNLKPYKNFFVPNLGSEAAISLFKELLMFGYVKRSDKTRKRISFCVKEDPSGFKGSIKSFLDDNTINYLLEKIPLGDWDSIGALAKNILRQFTMSSIKKSFPNQLKQWSSFLVNHCRNLFSKKSGFFIVLIGPDGSGKTTVSEILKGVLYKNIFKNYFNLHKDFGVLPQLKAFKSIFCRNINKKNEQSSSVYIGMVSPHSTIKSIAYMVYYFIDSFLGIPVVMYYKWRDSLIIADRYFYDYYYQLTYSNAPKSIINVMSFFVPKPDIIILCESDPETIHNRKMELTIEEILRQYKEIESAGFLRNKYTVVRTNTEFECTEKNIIHVISSALINRYQDPFLVKDCST